MTAGDNKSLRKKCYKTMRCEVIRKVEEDRLRKVCFELKGNELPSDLLSR